MLHFKLTAETHSLCSLAYNRVYLATVLRTSAQVHRSARNFRYAQPLDAHMIGLQI